MASKRKRSSRSSRRSRGGARRHYGNSIVPGTRVEFGQERTPADCRARAAWEREQAEGLKHKGPGGRIMAKAHADTALAYDWLARKREGKNEPYPHRARPHAGSVRRFR